MNRQTYTIPFIIILLCVFSGTAMAQDAEPMLELDAGQTVTMDANVDMAQVDDMSVPPSNAPANWGCDPQWYEDGVCDCGCAVRDSDCPRGLFDICERSGCAEGQVPWEHRPNSCMRSACGDGWVDEVLGEVCDDGEALASGGCSADCQSVNPGWTCGTRADGCEADDVQPQDMEVAVVDAMATDASVGDLSVVPDEVTDANAESPAPSSDARALPSSDLADAAPQLDLITTTPKKNGGCSVDGHTSQGAGPTLFAVLSILILGARARRRTSPKQT